MARGSRPSMPWPPRPPPRPGPGSWRCPTWTAVAPQSRNLTASSPLSGSRRFRRSGSRRRAGALPDHAQGHRADRRAREATETIPQHRPAPLHVDVQGLEGVDQGDAVGALPLADPGHLGDVRDVGRELHQQRGRSAPRVARTSSASTVGILAELDPTALHVGTGGVDLDPGHLGHAREPLAHFGVALDLGAEDAGDHRHPGGISGSFSSTKASTPRSRG